MLRIKLTSQELPVCFLTDRDVEKVMGDKIEFLKELISITKEILSDLRPYAFDKISLYARTSDPDYPTKIRAMAGCYGRYSVVRSFSANERNRDMGRRRSNNFCIIKMGAQGTQSFSSGMNGKSLNADDATLKMRMFR